MHAHIAILYIARIVRKKTGEGELEIERGNRFIAVFRFVEGIVEIVAILVLHHIVQKFTVFRCGHVECVEGVFGIVYAVSDGILRIENEQIAVNGFILKVSMESFYVIAIAGAPFFHFRLIFFFGVLYVVYAVFPVYQIITSKAVLASFAFVTEPAVRAVLTKNAVRNVMASVAVYTFVRQL